MNGFHSPFLEGTLKKTRLTRTNKTLCERCGSIQITKAQSELPDKLVAFFTSRRPFVCRRCGWRGRRNWTDTDLRSLLEYGAGGAVADQSLAELDSDSRRSRRRKRRWRQAAKRLSNNIETKPQPQRMGFDLGPLDLANVESVPALVDTLEPNPSRIRTAGRRSMRKRMKRSRRREIAATVAATILVMVLIAALGLTGSCGNISD